MERAVNNIAFTSGNHGESCVLASVCTCLSFHGVRVGRSMSFHSDSLMIAACIVGECEQRQH